MKCEQPVRSLITSLLKWQCFTWFKTRTVCLPHKIVLNKVYLFITEIFQFHFYLGVNYCFCVRHGPPRVSPVWTKRHKKTKVLDELTPYIKQVSVSLPNKYCVASSVIVGRPSICFQLIPRKATLAVNVLASSAGSRDM